MADENPLKLPPPIIGNPLIGDVGRGGDPAMTPRRPAIPFVLWYGANEPVPPSTDTPPRPTVVTADGPITAPMVGYNIIKTMVSPPDVQRPQPTVVGQQLSSDLFRVPFVFVERPLPDPPGGTPPEVLVHASVVPLQQLTPPWPFTYVSQIHADPPAAPIETPARPLVIKSLEAPTSLPEVFTAAIRAVADVPAKPVLVRAVELPWTPPYVFIDRSPSDPPVPPGVPIRPSVVTNTDAPPWVDFAGVSWTIPAPIAPPLPTVVRQIPVPLSPPFVSIGARKTEPPAAAPTVPIHSTVVTADGPIEAPFVAAFGFNADSGILSVTDTPNRALVVPQQLLPQTLPFVSVFEPKVFAAAPVAGEIPPRPFVVRAQEPPPPVDQVTLWTAVSDWRPPDPTIVGAGPVPQAKPFVFVAEGSVDPAPQPPVPIRPTVIGAQPFPPAHGQSIAKHGFADAAAAVETPVPIRPTVVGAQPLPSEYGQAITDRGFAVALPPPEVPPKPIVINAQPLPTQYVQAPWVSYTEVDPPKVPVYPTVVGQQPIPPQAAFVFTPRGGRWGDPPPRIITPTVKTDMSLPFRPNGWVRVAHGFAQALPVLFEGSVTGGTRDGASVGGGVAGGAGVTGQVQAGYVTGGVR